mmetsp:Transcript_14961/g.21621  ORF Transcript_14961/g.21621 Transcript_14961/m.21621 type:complete len:131 (+) Transcript_14961:108-500(+)
MVVVVVVVVQEAIMSQFKLSLLHHLRRHLIIITITNPKSLFKFHYLSWLDHEDINTSHPIRVMVIITIVEEEEVHPTDHHTTVEEAACGFFCLQPLYIIKDEYPVSLPSTSSSILLYATNISGRDIIADT